MAGNEPAQPAEPGGNRSGKPNDRILQTARRAVDGALSRDRGRLLGLWSRWSGKPGDAALQAAFANALAPSVAAREARAATLPTAVEIDPSLPIAGEGCSTEPHTGHEASSSNRPASSAAMPSR